MKKMKVFFSVLIIACIIFMSGCGGSSTVAETVTEAKPVIDDNVWITQKDLGFKQWIPMRFFDVNDAESFSDVIADAPNKCLIIPSGIMQMPASSGNKKCLFLKDNFGHVFSIHFDNLYYNVVNELIADYIPLSTDRGYSMSKADYNKLWEFSEDPEYGLTKPEENIRGYYLGTIYLHVSPTEVYELFRNN